MTFETFTDTVLFFLWAAGVALFLAGVADLVSVLGVFS